MKFFFLLGLCLPVAGVFANDANITGYGAVPGTNKVNTEAIQKAIDYCASTGGGRVTVPAGKFLTGTIKLRSNVELYISKGGVILGSTADKDFVKALIYAEGQENISITGEGVIDGQGTLQHFPRGSNRHRNIMFERCKNINVKDITLKNSSTWVMHLSRSEDVIVRGIRIHSYSNENNDGIDIDNSRNVVIADCILDCEDDVIVIKSGDINYVVENIAVTNCIISTNCNGIKFGTGSRGIFRNVAVSNCVIRKPTDVEHRKWGKVKGVSGDSVVISGIALEVVDGGLMDQVVISNIAMTGVMTPVFVRLGNRNGKGVLKNVMINNITATNESMLSSCIVGVPGSYVENITLSNILFNNRGGGTMKEATDTVPEKEAAYPENMMFGYSLPAYGLYLRHARNVVIENMRLQLQQQDYRPAIVADDCYNVRINGLDAAPSQEDQPVIRAIGSKGIIVSGDHSVEEVPSVDDKSLVFPDPFDKYLDSAPGEIETISAETDSGVVVRRLKFRSRDGINTIYAVMCSPLSKGKYPGLLLLHGGGSCADEFLSMAKEYAARGYVTMAPDLPGITDPKKAGYSEGAWKSLSEKTARFNVSEGPGESILADGIVAALEAFNILRMQPVVDSNKMGITGNSWGGYATTFLSGLLGKKVKAAYSVFGCGYYDKGSRWAETIRRMPGTSGDVWLNYLDAGRRAPGIRADYFIDGASDDRFFWPPAVEATLDAVKSDKNHTWGPNYDHEQTPSGPAMRRLFFDYHLKKKGKPFCKVDIEKIDNNIVYIAAEIPRGISVNSVILYYSEKTGWPSRKWVPVKAKKQNKKLYAAIIPSSLKRNNIDFYAYLTDERLVSVSSRMRSY